MKIKRFNVSLGLNVDGWMERGKREKKNKLGAYKIMDMTTHDIPISKQSDILFCLFVAHLLDLLAKIDLIYNTVF